jgi:hypothetical protein
MAVRGCDSMVFRARERAKTTFLIGFDAEPESALPKSALLWQDKISRPPAIGQ